jgi:predicted enzyme related to lactoylglutathione lyase
MADPFDALSSPIVPTDPDPAFAARLRARIERASSLPEGVTVSNLTLEPEVESRSATQFAPSIGAAIPYIAVRDGRRAIDWYVDVLHARLVGDPIMMPDGRVGHAELEISGGTMYLAEEFPEIGVVAPSPDQTAVSLYLSVPDVDATIRAAVDSGAFLARAIGEEHGTRNATIVDPFGHRWMLNTPLASPARVAVEWRQGDIAYASLWVPDADRAARFFAEVLGWTYEPGSTGPSRHVTNTTFPHGIFETPDHHGLFCCYAVDDVAAAVGRARDAGGHADAPTDEPYGRVANCTDNQGTPFALVQLPSDGSDAEGDRPVNGTIHGDLTYVTLEVTDSRAVRDFYGSVLGWQTSPGHVEDGWQIDRVMPMTGLWGGADAATGVPMYRVDDIETAVERVRAAGGTATDPEQQSYGISVDCVDDQGTRFYLGQV